MDRVQKNSESGSVNGTSSGNPLRRELSQHTSGYIEHSISKLDTLAGIAIKYGVEIADIKKMNGLVADLQMFALKSLRIPLPGRHPPSSCLSNGSKSDSHGRCEQTPSSSPPSDLFESFQSLKLKSSSQRKVSPAMSSLQGYYGLKPIDQKSNYEGCEMAVFTKGGSHYLEDEHTPTSSPNLSHHRKSKSLVNNSSEENGELPVTMPTSEAGEGDLEKWSEKLVRRRQKSVTDLSRTPESLLKEDVIGRNSNGGGFSSFAGKGLALRLKSSSRTALANDSEAGGLIPIPIGLGDSFVADSFSAVRKSLSTPSLQDSENGGGFSSSSSIRPTTKRSLKQDMQGFSTTAIATQIFDGLPKPLTGRKSKAALD